MNETTELELKEYISLMKEQPELFAYSEQIPIETDIEKIRRFIKENNCKIGVLYHSGYNMLVTDLIKDGKGGYYVYERIIPSKKGAVVAAASYKGKLVLLKQYRHALRDYQLAFVRGFGENGISPQENAAKEISEELGVEAVSCKYLGDISPDSGLTGCIASVFFCEIDKKPVNMECEGIKEIFLLSVEELEKLISDGKITDGFTLAAYALYKNKITI